MEPNYVGPNGRINAMAVAELFADDFAFFNPDEISWDGRHHAVTGIQFNAAKIDEYPVFVEHVAQLVPGIGDLLTTIEQDEELIVPRAKIARGLYGALREGDFTGITLFNLQACGKALWIQPDGDDYKVFVDSRVGLGIPGLYRLVARMVEDMRAYNEIEGSARVVFFSTRNFDANEYLGDVDSEVEGAMLESIHVEEIGGVAPADGACAEDGKFANPDDVPALAAADALVPAVEAEAKGTAEPVGSGAALERDTLRSIRDYLTEQVRVCESFSAHTAEVIGGWITQIDERLEVR